MKYDVFQYLNLDPSNKVEVFLDTLTELSKPANYWFNFKTVESNHIKYSSDVQSLNNLIGLSEEQIVNQLMKNSNYLLMVPKLLGIRDDKFIKKSKDKLLAVQGVKGDYLLNFTKVDMTHFEDYIDFFVDSGLMSLFTNARISNTVDYCYGVEAGMDSNARKNRSGKLGELILDIILKDLSDNERWFSTSQVSSKTISELYGIDLGDSFSNRRFDGSLYDLKRKKVYLFEVNNFNSSGSKSKASATEFKDLQTRFSKTNHEFIYITDGLGWLSDKSHLEEAMEHIGKVFNLKMIENGYLSDYLEISPNS